MSLIPVYQHIMSDVNVYHHSNVKQNISSLNFQHLLHTHESLKTSFHPFSFWLFTLEPSVSKWNSHCYLITSLHFEDPWPQGLCQSSIWCSRLLIFFLLKIQLDWNHQVLFCICVHLTSVSPPTHPRHTGVNAASGCQQVRENLFDVTNQILCEGCRPLVWWRSADARPFLRVPPWHSLTHTSVISTNFPG